MSPIYGGGGGVSPEEYNVSFLQVAFATTISATSKPISPDYSLTFAWSALAERFTFMDLACALWVKIMSFNGGGNTLNYEIDIDGVLFKTGTLSTAGSTGWKGVAGAVVASTPTVPVDAVVDVYLWVNAGTCVLGFNDSIVLYGPGCPGATGWAEFVLNAVPGNALVNLWFGGTTPANILADTLFLTGAAGDTGLADMLFSTGAAGTGGVSWPPDTGVPVAAAVIPTNVPLHFMIYPTDGPTCLVYYLDSMNIVFYIDN